MSVSKAAGFGFETAIATALIAATSLAVVASSGLEIRYKLAAVIALAGSAVLVSRPERRIACVVLWILIHPLGIEKIIPIDAAEGPQFVDPSIAINASDGPLFLLLLFLIGETVLTERSAFRWSRMTTVSCLILVWSFLCYVVHAHYLDDGFVTSSPLALLQDVRLALFVVLIQSAVRTRGEVIAALLAVGVAVLMQTVFVGLSYSQGHVLSYAASASGSGGDLTLQTYSSSGSSELVRATGTVGQTNEQAMFHVFMTIPLVALFAARNRVVRGASLLIAGGSALALVLTFSRGAWLAFPFGLVICGAIALRRHLIGRKTMLVGATSMVGGAVVLLFLAQPIYERLMFGDTGATGSRLRMLQLAKELFELHPLVGVGPGEFAEAALRIYPPRYIESERIVPGEKQPFPPPVIGRVDIVQAKINGEMFRRPLPVHNKYMLMLSELGVLGLALWLWLCVEFIRAGWVCSKLADPLLQMLGIGGVGLAAAEMLYMMVDLFHEDKPLEIMFFGPALVGAAARLKPALRRPVRSMASADGRTMPLATPIRSV